MSREDEVLVMAEAAPRNAALAHPVLPSSQLTDLAEPLAATPPDPRTVPIRRRSALDRASTWAMPAVLVVLIGYAAIAYEGFFDSDNLRNIVAQNAPVAIIAVAMTLVMVGGGFDLSVGSVFGCGSALMAELYGHVPLGVGLLVVVVLGCALGAVNGVLVTVVKVNPFVATLGTASVFGGAGLILTHSSPVVVDDPAFTELGQGTLLSLQYSTWILIGVTVVLGVVLGNTVYGHNLYATGGNVEAARLAGLRVNTARASTYVLVGAAAALSGAILASRLGVGQADVGANIPLQAIAMVVIGGTSLFGGEGSVRRTCVGIGILAVLGNVADANGWGAEIQSVVQGSTVVLAVALDAFVRSRRSK